jgi:hypothetical protein
MVRIVADKMQIVPNVILIVVCTLWPAELAMNSLILVSGHIWNLHGLAVGEVVSYDGSWGNELSGH